jgi:hypothetical protein
MFKGIGYLLIIIATLTGGSYVYANVLSESNESTHQNTIKLMPLHLEENYINKNRVPLQLVVSGPFKNGFGDQLTNKHGTAEENHYILKANKHTINFKDFPINELFNFDHLKDINAELKLASVMTLAEYAEMIGEPVDSYPTISPNRMLLIVQIYYPDGYDHPKVGFITNCLATAVYDIEMQNYIESGFKSLN